MSRLDTIIERTDRSIVLVGRTVALLVPIMVAVGAYNALVRTLDREVGTDLSSNTFLEIGWYLFALVFLLAAAWAVVEDRHVRVDVLSTRLSERNRIRVDLLGTLLLLIPFCLFLLWATLPSAIASFEVREMSPDPGGLPRWPLRFAPVLGVLLLLAAALSSALKDIRRLRQVGSTEKDDA